MEIKMFNLQIKIYKSVLILLFAVNSLSIFAGTEITMIMQSPGSDSEKYSTISMENNNLRFSSSEKNNNSETQQMIYLGESETMLMIDHPNRSYTKIDQETMNEISGKMSAAMKQMEAQLANMPAAQREMMEKMMQGKMPGMADKPEKKDFVFKETSRTDSVADYQCKITEMYLDGKKDREFCVTSWSNIGNSEEIHASFEGMLNLFQKMFESFSKQFPVNIKLPFSEIQELDGYPIIVTEFNADKITNVTRLVSIKEKSFPKYYFSIPEGYNRTEMMNPGR